MNRPESACPYDYGDARRTTWLVGYREGLELKARGKRGRPPGKLTAEQKARRKAAREQKARDRGRHAGSAGTARSACPYDDGPGSSFFRRLWLEGHDSVTGFEGAA